MEWERLPSGSLRVLIGVSEWESQGLPPVRSSDYPAFSRLLRWVKRETGEDFPQSSPLLAELYPLGSMYVLLLCSHQGRLRLKEGGRPLVYALATLDDLLLFASGCHRLDVQEPPATLYQVEGEYRLVLFPDKPLLPGLRVLLSEIARPCGQGIAAAAMAAERGEPLIVGRALAKLAGHRE